MKIIEEPWLDFDDSETVALSLEKDGQYTISELIELLESLNLMFLINSLSSSISLHMHL